MHAAANRRRAAILAAAEQLFHRYGPAKTTVADIAQHARVGVGTVYLEFPSKHAIYAALSELRHAAVLRAVAAAWEAPAPDHATRLERALDARFDGFLAAVGAGDHAPALFEGLCAPVEAAQARFREAERRLFARFLTVGADAGEIDAGDDPGATAGALLRCYAAFAPPLLPPCTSPELRRDLRAVHHVVLRGLLVRPPPTLRP